MPGPAEKISVLSGGRWHALKKVGISFEGTVQIENGDVTVMAAMPNAKTGVFQALLRYTAL